MPDDDHARILSWLQCLEPTVADGEDLERPLKRRRPKRRLQMPTPTTSTAEMNEECDATPPTKRRRPNDTDNGFQDTDRTPRRSGDSALSASSSRSSATSSSRLSPTKHLARLEVTPENPVLMAHIRMSDDRMPPELRTLLGELDAFQSRAGIVPRYLAAEAQERARNDHNFHNIQPWTFKEENTAGSASIGPDSDPDPKISIDQVVKIFEATEECLVEDHAEATWNTIVHWPVFELAFGPIREGAGPAPNSQDRTGSHSQGGHARVRGMPCTAARLTGRSYGSKMVDYCMFVEPQPCEAAKIAELRSGLIYINHTDYHALRQRPIVLSAESKKPSEGGRNAQLQLSVWQAAQWAFLEDLVTARETAEQPAMIPFLPALIIHGHEWHFAATTRSGNTTVCKNILGTSLETC